MKGKNKVFSVLAIGIVALGGVIFGLSRASADDASELLQKQNEAIFEAQKKADENLLESQKKSLENSLEAAKKGQEQLREAQKKEQEQLREAQKKANELIKEASSSADEDIGDDNSTSSVSGEDSDENEKEGNNKDDGEHYRSVVANFVQNLERIASSTPRGIGERVREVAREQNNNTEKTAKDLTEVESRGAFVKFFLGVNQDSIKSLETSVSILQNHIDNLTQIKASTTQEIQKSLDKEIKVLTKEKERVESVVNDNKGVVGIFGWFMHFFR